MLRPPPRPPLFPYTTLFRSIQPAHDAARLIAGTGAGGAKLAALAERLDQRQDDRELAIFHRSEEHTSELQSPDHLVCRLLLEKKKQEAIIAINRHNTTDLTT